jgi:hypothetical protein
LLWDHLRLLDIEPYDGGQRQLRVQLAQATTRSKDSGSRGPANRWNRAPRVARTRSSCSLGAARADPSATKDSVNPCDDAPPVTRVLLLTFATTAVISCVEGIHSCRTND